MKARPPRAAFLPPEHRHAPPSGSKFPRDSGGAQNGAQVVACARIRSPIGDSTARANRTIGAPTRERLSICDGIITRASILNPSSHQ